MAIVSVLVVILLLGSVGAYLLTQKSGTPVTASSTCTPVPVLTQTISLSNATSPAAVPAGSDLVFPLPVPASRLDPHVVDNFTLTTGGPVEVDIYNSTEYLAFQAAFNVNSTSGAATDTNGENVGYLFSTGTVSTGSIVFTLPNANATYYLVYVNRSLVNPLTAASNADLIWSLPSC